jgi:hypothetical protein
VPNILSIQQVYDLYVKKEGPKRGDLPKRNHWMSELTPNGSKPLNIRDFAFYGKYE